MKFVGKHKYNVHCNVANSSSYFCSRKPAIIFVHLGDSRRPRPLEGMRCLMHNPEDKYTNFMISMYDKNTVLELTEIRE